MSDTEKKSPDDTLPELSTATPTITAARRVLQSLGNDGDPNIPFGFKNVSYLAILVSTLPETEFQQLADQLAALPNSEMRLAMLAQRALEKQYEDLTSRTVSISDPRLETTQTSLKNTAAHLKAMLEKAAIDRATLEIIIPPVFATDYPLRGINNLPPFVGTSLDQVLVTTTVKKIIAPSTNP